MLHALELDDAAGVDVDEVVVAAVLSGLVAGPAATEIPALQDAALLQQPNGAVDGGNGDAPVEPGGAAVQLLDVRMVLGLRQHARDDAALPGHLQPLLDAQTLDARFHQPPLGAKRQSGSSNPRPLRAPGRGSRSDAGLSISRG